MVTTQKNKLKPVYFLIISGIFALICVFSLRANNEHMISLRNKVYAADKNNMDVNGALQSLQSYVTTHMNTNLSSGNGSVYPPIQLQYTYQRLLASESQNLSTTNTTLYTAAENYCQAKIPTGFSGRYRIDCITQYIESHDLTLPKPSTALYEFNFQSPTWSPDLAGISLALTILFFILFIILQGLKLLYSRYN